MALSRHERAKRKVDLNPLEMIEKLVAAHDWPFDRTSDREIAVEVAGRWCDYRMFFSWREDVEALHFTCAYDVRIPSERQNDIHVLLA
ncbi:MAG TPA: YbjN domain-containing protein, partial [Reyranella sp.]|nr:YbjN domain-containing protein [Reyranella sp.]